MPFGWAGVPQFTYGPYWPPSLPVTSQAAQLTHLYNLPGPRRSLDLLPDSVTTKCFPT